MTLDDLLGRYLNVAIVVPPTTVPRVVLDDPDDDQVLACARTANAELIVSGDKHLLNMRVAIELCSLFLLTRKSGRALPALLP